MVVKIDRWFPSSKLCSNCLYLHHDPTLANRLFHCPLCGLVLDRDYNAALNIANYYTIYKILLFPVAESSAETLNACGNVVRPTLMEARVVESGRTAPKVTSNNSP